MMLNRFYGILLLLTTCMMAGLKAAVSAQSTSAELKNNPAEPILAVDGSFFIHFPDKQITSSQMLQQLEEERSNPGRYSFIPFDESEDQLGYRHLCYQSYYAGIPIEGDMVLLHEKEGFLSHSNGRISRLPNGFNMQPALSSQDAVAIAKSDMQLMPGIAEPLAELVIIPLPEMGRQTYALAYKIAIEGKKQSDHTYTKMNVFIDARSGVVIRRVSLIHYTATEARAHTLYSGIQTITTESSENGYLLYDKARRITTYNFEQATVASNGRIDKLLNYINPSTTWGEVLALDSVSLFATPDTVSFPANGNWTPQFYALTSRSAQFWSQGPIGDPEVYTIAPTQFGNIGLSLTHAPYTGLIGAYNKRNRRFSEMASFTLKAEDIVLGTHTWLDTAGNGGTYTIRMKANPALDVHWGMSRTYDYYKERFSRNSYDNRSGPIINMVNGAYAYSGTQAQAAALSDGYMVFGLGDRLSMTEVVSLDVAAHEFSHMVINYNGKGGLVYQGESGALNESFADIFGACIEFYAKGDKANWQIGEEIFLVPPFFFRSMAEPKASAVPNSASVAQPDTYQEEYWADPYAAYDAGGVHVNSGVQNKWFYLLCEGGRGTNDKRDDYEVTGIGIKKAEQIAYRNLMTYLTPYAQYVDAYRGALQAAADLFGDSSTEYAAVKAAWFAVGVGENSSVVRQELKDASLQIYPNPASGQFVVASTLDIPIAVSMVNILGAGVQQFNVKPGINTIAIASLPKGLYFLHYEYGGRRSMLKLSVR